MYDDLFDVPSEPVRSGFHMRFSSRNARDLLLSKWIAEDTYTGNINISDVIKDLLYAWYMERFSNNGQLPAPIGLHTSSRQPQLPAGQNGRHEEHEDPNDPLVQSLVGLSFDNI